MRTQAKYYTPNQKQVRIISIKETNKHKTKIKSKQSGHRQFKQNLRTQKQKGDVLMTPIFFT